MGYLEQLENALRQMKPLPNGEYRVKVEGEMITIDPVERKSLAIDPPLVLSHEQVKELWETSQQGRRNGGSGDSIILARLYDEKEPLKAQPVLEGNADSERDTENDDGNGVWVETTGTRSYG